jgi:hypothetical protein
LEAALDGHDDGSGDEGEEDPEESKGWDDLLIDSDEDDDNEGTGSNSNTDSE